MYTLIIDMQWLSFQCDIAWIFSNQIWFLNNFRNIPTLKQKCCHFHEIFIAGCNESCQEGNSQWSQWWNYNDINISVTNILSRRLTHCGPVTPYDNIGLVWVNTGSGDGLLLDGTKPLPEGNLTGNAQDKAIFLIEFVNYFCYSHISQGLMS